MTPFITIEQVTGDLPSKVRQTLRNPSTTFVWRIKFNIPLNPTTVNDKTCYITNTQGQSLSTTIRYSKELQSIEITPIFAYSKDASYILHVTTEVESIQGKTLPHDIQVRFHV